MQFSTVLFEEDEQVGIIRLNRPERMNAVIEQMYLDLQNVLAEIEQRESIRALVLTGTVWKRNHEEKQAFCAGADLKKHATKDRTAWQKREYIMLAHETTRRIHEFPKPIVCAINGPARGAGAELALACDLILMAKQATLAFTETSLGTFVGGGVTKHLANLVGMQKAKYFIYTGEIIDAAQAQSMGLALNAFHIHELLPQAVTLAKRIASKAPISIRFAKQMINEADQRDLDTILRLEAEAILACMNTEDWHEGLASFSNKRNPVFQGR